ncbi:hypothetical protein N2W54_006128 [Lotmaria passim]
MSVNDSALTLYIRCTGIHSRGELLNGFFHAHREALGLQDYFTETSDVSDSRDAHESEPAAAGRVFSSCLPADFPVEVVFMRQSRKPYFLVEWRYPTQEEMEKQKGVEDDALLKPVTSLAKEPHASSSSNAPADHLPVSVLDELAQRTLSLGKQAASEGGLVWRDQPVIISVAMAGMTVAAERAKLELRDAQLKAQHVAEKRAREETDTGKKEKEKSVENKKSTQSFVPRSVRRRA